MECRLFDSVRSSFLFHILCLKNKIPGGCFLVVWLRFYNCFEPVISKNWVTFLCCRWIVCYLDCFCKAIEYFNSFSVLGATLTEWAVNFKQNIFFALSGLKVDDRAMYLWTPLLQDWLLNLLLFATFPPTQWYVD